MHQLSHSDDRSYVSHLAAENDTLQEENRRLKEIIDGLAQDVTVCVSLHLSGPQALLYNTLKRYGRVSHERITDLLSMQYGVCEGDSRSARFVARNLRKKLPPDIRVVSVHGYGFELVTAPE